MTPKQAVIYRFLQKYKNVLSLGFSIISWSMVCDFLLLVTSLQCHWFRPFWNAATGRGMLIVLISLSVLLFLNFALGLGLELYLYQRKGYNVVTGRRLTTHTGSCIGLVLGIVWAMQALAGHPTMLPLKWLGLTWFFSGVALSRVFSAEARRKSKVRITSSSGRGPLSPNGRHG